MIPTFSDWLADFIEASNLNEYPYRFQLNIQQKLTKCIGIWEDFLLYYSFNELVLGSKKKTALGVTIQASWNNCQPNQTMC